MARPVAGAEKPKKVKQTLADRRFIENELDNPYKVYQSEMYKRMMEKVATRPFYTK